MNAYIRDDQAFLVPKLFKPFNFPHQYKHYLNVVLCSDTLSKRQDRWKGKLAACIPKLVHLIEQCPRISLAHPWTEARTSVYNYSTLEEKADVRRGVFVNDPHSYYMSCDLNPGAIYRLDYYVALELLPAQPKSTHADDNVVDLSSAINTFIQDTKEKFMLRDPSASMAVTSVKR
jgi:poly(A) polymerase Pap1